MKIYEVCAFDGCDRTTSRLVTLDENKAYDFGMEVYSEADYVEMFIWQDEEIVEEYYINKEKQWVKWDYNMPNATHSITKDMESVIMFNSCGSSTEDSLKGLIQNMKADMKG